MCHNTFKNVYAFFAKKSIKFESRFFSLPDSYIERLLKDKYDL